MEILINFVLSILGGVIIIFITNFIYKKIDSTSTETINKLVFKSKNEINKYNVKGNNNILGNNNNNVNYYNKIIVQKNSRNKNTDKDSEILKLLIAFFIIVIFLSLACNLLVKYAKIINIILFSINSILNVLIFLQIKTKFKNNKLKLNILLSLMFISNIFIINSVFYNNYVNNSPFVIIENLQDTFKNNPGVFYNFFLNNKFFIIVTIINFLFKFLLILIHTSLFIKIRNRKWNSFENDNFLINILFYIICIVLISGLFIPLSICFIDSFIYN